MLQNLNVRGLFLEAFLINFFLAVQAIFTALVFFWLIMLLCDLVYAIYLILKSNVVISKFFTSKIHRKEEKILFISEEEMRGLNKSALSSSRDHNEKEEKDSGSGSGSGHGSRNSLGKESKSSSAKIFPINS